jgi:hypothetical protein
MTAHDQTNDPQGASTERDATHDVPLAPWMLAMAKDAVDELDADVVVPREMMWARIERERRQAASRERRPRLGQVAALAAVLVGGVAIGRYAVPAPYAPTVASADSATRVTAARTTASTDSILASRSDPAHVAMQEHLVRTVVLLAAVQNPTAQATRPDLGPWAGELLTTTRLLIDQPQLRDERTRRLLHDLELVLMQIVQARSSAPETQRAPQETMRETDLLTRVRAVVTASNAYDGLTYGGN